MPSPSPDMLIRQLATGLLSTCLALAAGASGAQDKVRLPDLGGSAQTVLSPPEARQYGASMLHQMRAMHMVLDDPLVNDYLNDVGYRLVTHSDDPSQKFTFFIVNTQVINAFAAPGGYIGVNAGLIDLTHSEDELAAVMAHEIGHITQHHLERAFEASKKDAPLMALVLLGAIAAGAADSNDRHGYGVGYNGYNDGSSNAGMGVLAAGLGLIQQRKINFTRKDEVEADRTGMRTLVNAGYDPMAMASFFQRMESTLGGNDSVPALLQSHPVTLNRISDTKARARMLESDHEKSSVPPISLKQWHKITAPIRYVSNPDELVQAPGKGRHGLELYPLMRERVRVLSMDVSKAVDYYHSHLHRKGFDTPANHYGYALALTRDHQAAKALKQLQPLVGKYPSSLPLQLALADALDHDGRQSEALDIYARLNAGTPHDRAIVLAYAESLIRDKSTAHARKAAGLVKPLLNDTDEPRLFQTFARASEIAGNKVDAGEAWANASYLSGRPFDAMEQLKRLLKRNGLDYYQRARIQADIDQLRPVLLELQKRHIQTADRRRGGQGQGR